MFSDSAKVKQLRPKLEGFMAEHIYPYEKEWAALESRAADRWTIPPRLEELKKKGWIDPSSKLTCSEKYVHEQAHFNMGKINLAHPKASQFFETLHTDAIWNIQQNTERWKQAFLPLRSKSL